MHRQKLRLALAIAAFAAVLRALHLNHGLPDFVEEAIPFKRAFTMLGWEGGPRDLNPHLFHYPSLIFYLHAALQAAHFGVGRLLGAFTSPADFGIQYHVDPTAMVVLARSLGVAADVATVLGAWRLGERLRPGAGALAAALVALAPTAILNARAIVTDGVMAAFAVWAVERMIAWREQGGMSRLVTSAVLVGLAAGTKYPAAALVVPLAAAILARDGRRGWRALVLAPALAFAVFLATSPYVVLDFGKFLEDFLEVNRMASHGHFGNLGVAASGYYLERLVHNLGATALVLFALCLARGLTGRVREIVERRNREPAERNDIGGPALVVLALAVFATPVMAGSIQAERYLVPWIPLAAVLVSLEAWTLARQFQVAGRQALAFGIVTLIPIVSAAFAAAQLGADSTQLQTRRWIEQHAAPNSVILEEAYAAKLETPRHRQEVTSLAAFPNARPSLRDAYLARRPWLAVEIPLAATGRVAIEVRDAAGATRVLEIEHDAAGMNRMFYDVALLSAVDYLVTSDAVRGRHRADPARYPEPNRYYAWLDSVATQVACFRATGGTDGPEIRVYEIRDEVRARLAPIDSLWWMRPLDLGRPEFAAVVRGGDAEWAEHLRPMYRARVRPFAYDLARSALEAGRCGPATRLARSILTVVPDGSADRILERCAGSAPEAPLKR